MRLNLKSLGALLAAVLGAAQLWSFRVTTSTSAIFLPLPIAVLTSVFSIIVFNSIILVISDEKKLEGDAEEAPGSDVSSASSAEPTATTNSASTEREQPTTAGEYQKETEPLKDNDIDSVADPDAPKGGKLKAAATEQDVAEVEDINYRAFLAVKQMILVAAEHKLAIKELERLADQSQPNNLTCSASMVLGDLYAGLLDTPFRLSLDLPKAFLYYLTAIKAPHNDVARAHYMIHFITMYHPDAVTPEYRVQYAEHVELEEKSDEKDVSEDGKSKSVSKSSKFVIKPNVPVALVHLAMSAKGGDRLGRASLAMKYLRGQYTPKSCRHAADSVKKVTEELSDPFRDNPRANVKLATDTARLDVEYEQGKSQLDEERDLIQYYQFHAERGYAKDAQVAMGLLHLTGAGNVAVDYDRSFYYLSLAAGVEFDDDGVLLDSPSADAGSLTHLAYLYHHGYGVERDDDKAVQLWTKAAEMGSSNAEMHLGMCYLLGGCGLVMNAKEAKKYFSEAAAQEEPEALYQLGMMFDSPAYGTPNSANARLHYQRAAQAGHIVAMHELAVLQLEGPNSCDSSMSLLRKVLEFTELRNRTIAAYYEYSSGRVARALIRYEIAADLGLPLAQRNLAFLYDEGFGVHDLGVNMTAFQTQAKALYWYRESAFQESASANLKLGDFYFYGIGTEPDLFKSAQFYTASSTLRNPQASFNLGYMHQYGIGLDQDYHLAKRFYDLAVDLNPSEARIPAYGALLWMQLEAFGKRIVKQNDNGIMKAIEVLGMEWDSALIVVLTGVLLVALLLRSCLR